jgi:hypothetical protein
MNKPEIINALLGLTRHEPGYCSSEIYQGMNPEIDGDYVEFDDIVQLIRKIQISNEDDINKAEIGYMMRGPRMRGSNKRI